MKILIIGAGAVGLNYGLRLLEAERKAKESGDTSLFPHEVCFIMRSDLQIVANHGIKFYCNDQDPIVLEPNDFRGKIFSSETEYHSNNGRPDLIIIAVKGYALDSELFCRIQAICGPCTQLLVILNGLGAEEDLATHFPRENIFGGISYIGCNRIYHSPDRFDGPLVVRNFKDHRLDIGHIDDNLTQLHSLWQLWQSTSIASLVHMVPNLLAARWRKLCWNIAFSGIAVVMNGLTVDVIDQDPALHFLADQVIDEVIAVAEADLWDRYLNRSLSADIRTEERIEELRRSYVSPFPKFEEWKAALWSATTELGAYKTSTVIDYLEGRDMEIRHIFSTALQRARRLSASSAPSLYFAHMESVILMVEAQYRLQQQRRLYKTEG